MRKFKLTAEQKAALFDAWVEEARHSYLRFEYTMTVFGQILEVELFSTSISKGGAPKTIGKGKSLEEALHNAFKEPSHS